MTVRRYTDLVAWQKAMDFVEMVYRATERFPREEIYGLRGQLREASVSVPSNIAEGYARRSDRELGRFLSISAGSLAEAETQIRIARRLRYLSGETEAQLLSQSTEVARLINGLRSRVAKDRDNSTRT